MSKETLEHAYKPFSHGFQSPFGSGKSKERGLGDGADDRVYVSHLTPQQHSAMAKLVGKKCTVKCTLDKTPVEILWDMGAQVSIMPMDVLQKHFPDCKLKHISKLLENGSKLNLEAANGTLIPYEGWVELAFLLKVKSHSTITVPFFVTEKKIGTPILGYNVIELFVKQCWSVSENDISETCQVNTGPIDRKCLANWVSS